MDRSAVLETSSVAGWVAALARLDPEVSDAERIDQIRLLEEIKSAAAAAQAVVTADFAASQRAQQRAAGAAPAEVGRGIAAQVALARRDSPHRGSRHLGLAEALVREMPETLAGLRSGAISEWRATIVVRETACLGADQRRVVDRELASRLAVMGDRQTETAARSAAYRLDPHAFMARSRAAERDKRVTLRPAPDTMSRLTGFLPVAHGVACYAALTKHADGLKAAGDPRGRGQIMAETLVERVTGQIVASATPVEVALVMTDATLLAGSDEPAELVGGGPVPAPMARDLVRETKGDVWVRRLFTRPSDGALVAMESRRRFFPEPLREFLVLRDLTCRTPWCGAPIRQADHVTPVEAGGATSADNGQGLCVTCNQTKQVTGWRGRPGPAGAGQLTVLSTPTGHDYTSGPPPAPRPPPAPGLPPPRRHARSGTDEQSVLERELERMLAAA